MFKSYWQNLIKKSKHRLAERGLTNNQAIGFRDGGKWMEQVLLPAVKPNANYRFWGLLKYLLSCLAFLLTSLTLWPLLGVVSLLVGVLSFYVIEVHLLFLFPLVADGEINIIRKTIEATYTVVFCTAYFNVLPIAAYMLIGLCKLQRPFYHWYVGCAAIVIWYEEEIRNRV